MIKRIIYCFLVLLGFVFSNATFSQNKSDFFGVKTVCIDAGHGGHDPGCHGLSSKEKHVALAMALKLGKHIEENFPDVKVVYTRKTDVYLKLWERAAIANKAKADLFICIHANANDNKAAYGTETYVMGLHKSESNLNVAKRENSSILLEEDYKTKYSDFDPNSPESYIVLTMRQDAFIDQSLSFAAKIQKQFKERVGRKDRGVKQAGFLVLHQTNMPSVLIETGFLTNREEEKFLVSDVGQDYLSSAIYRAFKEYKKELESKDGVTENIVDEKEEIKKPKEVVVKEVKPKTKEQIKKEKKDKKKNKGEVIAKGVVFKVQLATSSKKLELLPQNFKGIKNVEIYNAGGLYRYVVGKETNITDANSLQLRIRNKGYKDAFIIAFSDGKRISVSAALNLLK
ncbi:MAG: N-acetylmuramoyl-L-alanine amidase [Flavobacteriales bacterium]|nr:N-acetylmuramoyl-L-alanine amidase [Flavobacteriales bacterium]